jgi:hypothetical protein
VREAEVHIKRALLGVDIVGVGQPDAEPTIARGRSLLMRAACTSPHPLQHGVGVMQWVLTPLRLAQQLARHGVGLRGFALGPLGRTNP